MDSDTPFDVLVLGAGISGIRTAAYYMDTHPDCKLALIERQGTMGGTWSSERLYPGFKVQMSGRMAEFADMRISIPPGGVDENGCPDSKYIAQYLDTYVDNHVWNGKSLRDLTYMHSTITEVRKRGELWSVKFNQKGTEKELMARKLIVATGATSIPCWPDLKGKEAFGAPIFHGMDFGKHYKALTAPEVNKVIVLGGGKTAADMVYQLATEGKEVSWVIRKTGKGPAAFILAAGLPGFENLAELARTNLFSRLFLSGMKKKSWWDWFLWDSWPGQAFQRWFDGVSGRMTSGKAKWDERKDAREGFHLLKNESRPTFVTTPAGMIHYADFFDVVATKVDVYRKDIDHLEHHKVVFTDGSSIDSDAFVCGTGYLEEFTFFTKEENVRLGLPHDPNLETPEEREEWAHLEAEAEKEIIAQYPILAPSRYPQIPEHFGDIDTRMTPYRLHNVIAPLNDRTIAFIGFVVMPNIFEEAEVAAAWATAYLDGVIKLPDAETMKREVAYTNAYMRLRMPTYGRIGTFFLFDTFPWIERCLDKDLGLKSWHHKSWFAEWFSPFLPRDYVGLKDEYLRKYGKQIAANGAAK